MISKHMIKNARQNTIRNWAIDTFKKKVNYDIRGQFDTSIARRDEYLSANGFALTVILRRPSRPLPIRTAQERLHTSFSDYYNTVLGHQCMTIGRLSARNWKFLPMTFLAFDNEGTRNNSYSEMTSEPHGHGGILFHETTIATFKRANARFLQPDGSYQITNPTKDIVLIELKPIASEEGMIKFLHYALKFGVKLDDNETNFSPYNFYPRSSPKYPFWQTLQSAPSPLTGRKTRKDRDLDTIEWLRNMESPGDRFRRSLGRGGSGETSPMLPI